MPAQLTAAAVASAARAVDSAWSHDAQTLRRPRGLRISAFTFIVAGRGGVLGDAASPEVVASALGIYEPAAVQAAWAAAGRVGPSTVAAQRLAECARWGEEHLADVPGVDELAGLAERVVRAADAAALPHFAAVRAQPVPVGTPAARAAVQLHRLGELRAGVMLVATRACGLTPAEALIAGPEGAEAAVTFGWEGPFPARVRVLRRYTYAQALADRMTAPAYAVLTRAERADLVALAGAARDACAQP